MAYKIDNRCTHVVLNKQLRDQIEVMDELGTNNFETIQDVSEYLLRFGFEPDEIGFFKIIEIEA